MRAMMTRLVVAVLFVWAVGCDGAGVDGAPDVGEPPEADARPPVDDALARDADLPEETEEPGADADPPPTDVGGDSEAPPLVPAEVVITSGDGLSVLRVTTAPFAWALEDEGGGVRTTSADRGAGFTPVALGCDPKISPRNWVDPKLTPGDRLVNRLNWFSPAEVLSLHGGADDNGFTLTLASEDEEGTPGPEITVNVRPTAKSVLVTVTPGDELVCQLTVLSLNAAADEGFFGHGQHFDRLDGRGLVREMQIQAELRSESGTNEIHFPIPFVLSSALYGWWIDDRYSAAFDFAHFREDAVRYITQAPEVSFHLFVDDDPIRLLETYSDLTARPAPVPFWSMAPAWWRNRSNQEEFLDDARRAREHGIPTTLSWIDRPWQAYYQNFLFNSVLYPDPEAMFDEMHALGFLIMLHHSPQMNPPGQAKGLPEGSVDDPDDIYSVYFDNGWLVLLPSGAPFLMDWGGGLGAFVDWTHPDAVEYTQTLMARITDLGVVGTKMDWDEYLQPNIGSNRMEMSFFNGESTATMKSWYSVVYHKAIYEGLAAGAESKPFMLVRHGTSRGQQWGVCAWPGDLDCDFTEHTRGPSDRQDQWNVGGLPAGITAGLSLGMSGYTCYGSDIGGYRESPPSEETLLRWMAFGTFNGFMQLGGGGNTHMPWSSDTPYSPEALEITRKYFRLRMSLFPYILEQFEQAEATGRPVMRSLWLTAPDDPEARRYERDFMFGPALHAAPIYVEGASERTFYLPAGEWLDWWTGERREAGEHTLQAPIGFIPLHLKAGEIVPLISPEIDTLLAVDDPEIISFQDHLRTRLLHAPTGEPATARLLNGLEVSVTPTGDELTCELTVGEPDERLDERIRLAPEQVTLELLLDGTPWADGPWEVEFAGEPLMEGQPDVCESCFVYDASTRRLLIALPAESGTVQLRKAP